MGDKAWKAYERFVADIFSTRRNPLSGANNAGRTGDVIHPGLNIECKNHKTMTTYDWMKKAINESDKPALLFLHRKNRAYMHSVVCMPLEDFLKIKEDYMKKVANET
jgi:DNA-binding sugar fermentation-stimulating protein